MCKVDFKEQCGSKVCKHNIYIYIYIYISIYIYILITVISLINFWCRKFCFRKNSVFSRNPQFETLLVSIFWKFVNKWCGLKVNNYGIYAKIDKFKIKIKQNNRCFGTTMVPFSKLQNYLTWWKIQFFTDNNRCFELICI